MFACLPLNDVFKALMTCIAPIHVSDIESICLNPEAVHEPTHGIVMTVVTFLYALFAMSALRVEDNQRAICTALKK